MNKNKTIKVKKYNAKFIKKNVKLLNKSYNKSEKKRKRVFNKKEYSSGDGMLTSVWGPSLWH